MFLSDAFFFCDRRNGKSNECEVRLVQRPARQGVERQTIRYLYGG